MAATVKRTASLSAWLACRRCCAAWLSEPNLFHRSSSQLACSTGWAERTCTICPVLALRLRLAEPGALSDTWGMAPEPAMSRLALASSTRAMAVSTSLLRCSASSTQRLSCTSPKACHHCACTAGLSHRHHRYRRAGSSALALPPGQYLVHGSGWARCSRSTALLRPGHDAQHPGIHTRLHGLACSAAVDTAAAGAMAAAGSSARLASVPLRDCAGCSIFAPYRGAR